FWVCIPPTYFLIEYIHIFPDACKVDKDAFEDFKYTQDLSSKVWAGYIVVLTSMLYAKYNKEFK
ncbi:MAG TPA: hypothetical protein DCM71_25740, partial [Runella sp.]|nr:hypothetical protein [Runella sp.]